MKLEAVVTCVNYDDFLAATLPENRPLFDRLVVVTSQTDEKTKRVCEYRYVQVIQTDAFGAEGEFRKGAGINAGLQALDLDGWVLHLDADIVLPPETRRLLERADLDPRMVYGIDRHTLMGATAWARQLARPKLQQEAGVYVHCESYPVATRFMTDQTAGWLPIGFFQLWNPTHSGVRSYPEQHTNAGRADMLFAANWPRAQRALIPEIIGYHLESEKAPQGANWNGRKTRRFELKARKKPMTPCQWWKKHHHHPPVYGGENPTGRNAF